MIDLRKTKPWNYSYDAIEVLQQVWTTAGGTSVVPRGRDDRLAAGDFARTVNFTDAHAHTGWVFPATRNTAHRHVRDAFDTFVHDSVPVRGSGITVLLPK